MAARVGPDRHQPKDDSQVRQRGYVEEAKGRTFRRRAGFAQRCEQSDQAERKQRQGRKPEGACERHQAPDRTIRDAAASRR